MSEQLSLVQVSNCTLTETGAQFDPQTSFETWVEAGRRMCAVSARLNWWVGDWAMFGVENYGDKSAAALRAADELGLSSELIRQAMWVSERVQPVTRVTTLEWSHHREVAKLETKDQRKWLSQAVENGWSVSQMRVAMRKEEASSIESATGPVGFSLVGWASLGWLKLKQRMNEKPIEQWPQRQRDELKEGLKPIVEVYQRL